MELNKIQLSQRVPPSLNKELKTMAKRKGIKRSELIREALLAYVEDGKKSNEQAERRTLEA